MLGSPPKSVPQNPIRWYYSGVGLWGSPLEWDWYCSERGWSKHPGPALRRGSEAPFVKQGPRQALSLLVSSELWEVGFCFLSYPIWVILL
jgi:hypothetical protein